MRKKIYILILSLTLIFGYFSAYSETVSQKEAMKIAQLFFNSMYGEVTAPAKLVWNGRQLTTDRLFSPFYVYNSPKGGFVIISADNKAYPVLAYGSSVLFSRDRLGDEENDLLKKYAREIELIRYDSRIPTSAINAWQSLPDYISRTLNNPYNSSEYLNLSEAEKDRIELIDRRNGWIAMPSAVEFRMYNSDEYRDLTLDDILGEELNSEEIPFQFYENFIAEIKAEENARALELEEILSPSKPVVKVLGGSHFELLFPEEIEIVKVFAMDGSKALEKYFKTTSIVNLDLSSLNPGFYVAICMSEDGKIYGIKLYR